MYLPQELAAFAVSEFERGIEGLTDEDARVRRDKTGGTQMNAISWAISHIAGHWLSRPEPLDQFAFQSNDPTPPSLEQALTWLQQGREFTERWLPNANDELLASRPPELGGENIGTGVLRATLHTWFHCGEINAIRQLLGHQPIGFLGDIRGVLEWHPAREEPARKESAPGYSAAGLARFAISEFERGLSGLGDAEARVRQEKADGTTMNAITWTIGHIATHWLFDDALFTGGQVRRDALTFFGPNADPTPPSLDEMRAMLSEAKERAEAWLPQADDARLFSKRDFGPQADENLGTQLMRAVLHTWFHTGEINAVRQALGHDEIAFVGVMPEGAGWRSSPD